MLIGRKLCLIETHKDVVPFGDETKNIVPPKTNVIQVGNVLVVLVVGVDLIMINKHTKYLTPP